MSRLGRFDQTQDLNIHNWDIVCDVSSMVRFRDAAWKPAVVPLKFKDCVSGMWCVNLDVSIADQIMSHYSRDKMAVLEFRKVPTMHEH